MTQSNMISLSGASSFQFYVVVVHNHAPSTKTEQTPPSALCGVPDAELDCRGKQMRYDGYDGPSSINGHGINRNPNRLHAC